MTFLIDGYNLLYAVKSDGVYESLSDREFCRIVDAYLIRTGSKGEIVFDGRATDEQQYNAGIKKLRVSYSGVNSDADTVIESMISASTAPKLVTVVSNDRRLRDAAAKGRMNITAVEDFWHEVEKKLSKKGKHKAEPVSKRRGISEAETTQWLKFFGIDNK